MIVGERGMRCIGAGEICKVQALPSMERRDSSQGAPEAGDAIHPLQTRTT
jgi:hypothetical protein